MAAPPLSESELRFLRALLRRKVRFMEVLRVDRILAGKRAANRAKDRLVIPVLEDALAVSKAARKRKRASRTTRGGRPSG